ncbi:MAG: homoserine O-succinyltransferase [Chromatiales bacterium]|nr:homoserine O-succinyltransferase [Chromatiales bacterium]
MPLVAHNNLPTFERLRCEGQTILPPGRAMHQDIRELHIGLCNMMPDAALAATERQFFRLVGQSNPIAQFYMHPFTLPQLPRSAKARKHIADYYEDFEQLKRDGLDALIITGANVTHADLSDEPFWEPLSEVISWAWDNVTSTLCSCLATHAVLQQRHQQQRRPLGFKRWGVYSHKVEDRAHPLVSNVNTRFDVPHSRWNDISNVQFETAGLKVLVRSAVAGVHLAVSEDGFRTVYFQGHPEYDSVSLLKEYKREVTRYTKGEVQQYPPFPENYFSRNCQAILNEYRIRLDTALNDGQVPPELPEDLLASRVDNTWHDSAEAVVGNWIGKVYQVTHQERGLPFMEGVDPNDPLGLRIADCG